MQHYFVNPDLFFELEAGELLVWNYATHEQYLLNEAYVLTLLRLSQDPQCIDNADQQAIYADLLAGGLISEEPPQHNSWGWDAPSRIFHRSTQDSNEFVADLDAEAYSRKMLEIGAALSPPPALFLERPGPLIALPAPDLTSLDRRSLFATLKERKTSRNFYHKPSALGELSTILFATFGLIHGEWEELAEHGLQQSGLRKASPSGGGLYPEEAYVVVYRVEGLAPGLYHYRPRDHQLTQLAGGNFEEQVIRMNAGQFYAAGMAFGVYITARFERAWWKYPASRAYRVVLLDIGHVGQIFQLVATALGLNTWLTAAFHDSSVHQFLGVDGQGESAILYVGAGHGAGQTIPAQVSEQLPRRAEA